MANSYGPKGIVTDGIVFTSDAGNKQSYIGSSTTAYNLINETQTGTLTSAGIYSTNNGGIYDLNGTSDYIEFAQSNDLKFGTGDFCISTWYNWRGKDGSGRYDRLWFLGNVYNSYSLSCNVRASNVFEIRVNDGIRLTTGAILTTNVWQNLIIQRDGSNVQSYINGIYDDQNTMTDNLDNAGDYTFRLGVEGGTPDSSYWDGFMGPCIVYNKALTASEVLQNYNSQKSRFGL